MKKLIFLLSFLVLSYFITTAQAMIIGGNPFESFPETHNFFSHHGFMWSRASSSIRYDTFADWKIKNYTKTVKLVTKEGTKEIKPSSISVYVPHHDGTPQIDDQNIPGSSHWNADTGKLTILFSPPSVGSSNKGAQSAAKAPEKCDQEIQTIETDTSLFSNQRENKISSNDSRLMLENRQLKTRNTLLLGGCALMGLGWGTTLYYYLKK